MKRVITLIFILVLAVFVFQLYDLYSAGRGFKETFAALSKKLEVLKKENSELQADLQYFKEPENLAKELRQRFNLKKPGEKLIIVVPPKNE